MKYGKFLISRWFLYLLSAGLFILAGSGKQVYFELHTGRVMDCLCVYEIPIFWKISDSPMTKLLEKWQIHSPTSNEWVLDYSQWYLWKSSSPHYSYHGIISDTKYFCYCFDLFVDKMSSKEQENWINLQRARMKNYRFEKYELCIADMMIEKYHTSEK